MRADVSIWDNKKRLRDMVTSQNKVLASLCAINAFVLFPYKSWFAFALNIIFCVLVVIPMTISHTRWKKNPPINQNDNN